MGFSIAQKIVTVAKVLSQQEDAQTTKHKSFNNVVGFYCPCAGAGVTTLIGNIAVMLAAQKKNVCVVDLNVLFPEQMRYFLDEKMEKKMKSLTEKILKPNMHMRELINTTKIQGVSLVSTKFSDSIVTLINIREDAIIAMFNELREMFDYVLLDMGGIDIAYESTTLAFDHCDYVYTVIAPQLGMINAALKINNFLNEANYSVKLTRVLQNQIKDKPFKQSEFKQLGLSLLADMPYSEEIRQIGARFQFCCMSSSGSKTLSAYLSVLGILCKNIIQMSDVGNFSASEDGTVDESSIASADKQLSDNLGDVTGDKVEESETTIYEDLVGKKVNGVTGVPGGVAGMPPGARPPVPAGMTGGVPGAIPPGMPGSGHPMQPGMPGSGQPMQPGMPGMAQGYPQQAQRVPQQFQGQPGGINGIPQPGMLPQQQGGIPQQQGGIPQQFNGQRMAQPTMPGGVPQPGQMNPQMQGRPPVQQGMPPQQMARQMPQAQQPVPQAPNMAPNLMKSPTQPGVAATGPATKPQPTARKTAADIDWDTFI